MEDKYFQAILTIRHLKDYSQYTMEWYALSKSSFATYLNAHSLAAVTVSMTLDNNILKLDIYESIIKANKDAANAVKEPEDLIEIKTLLTLPYPSLCFLIGYIVNDNNLDLVTINLVAAPSMGTRPKKDHYKLIQYYESLGFQINEDKNKTVQEILNNKQQVLMTGLSSEILKVCRVKAKTQIDVRDVLIKIKGKKNFL